MTLPPYLSSTSGRLTLMGVGAMVGGAGGAWLIAGDGGMGGVVVGGLVLAATLGMVTTRARRWWRPLAELQPELVALLDPLVVEQATAAPDEVARVARLARGVVLQATTLREKLQRLDTTVANSVGLQERFASLTRTLELKCGEERDLRSCLEEMRTRLERSESNSGVRGEAVVPPAGWVDAGVVRELEGRWQRAVAELAESRAEVGRLGLLVEQGRVAAAQMQAVEGSFQLALERLAESTTERERLAQRLRDREQELAQLRSEFSEVDTQRQEGMSAHNLTAAELRELAYELERLRHDISVKDEDAAVLKRQLEDGESRLQRLETELRATGGENRTLHSALEEARRELALKNDEIGNLLRQQATERASRDSAELSSLATAEELREFAAERTRLRQTLVIKDEEIDQLRRRAAAAEAERFVTEERLTDQVTGLQERLAELTRRWETLQSAHAVLEQFKLGIEQHAAVSITDAAGRIEYVNQKFCEISDYSAEELLGSTHRIISSGHHGQEFYQKLWQDLEAGRVWHGTMRNQRRDGSSFWMEGTIVPFVGSDGRPFKFISIRTDVTKRVEAEQLAHGMALFALRNPAPVMRVAVDGTVLAANQAALEVLGVSAGGAPLPGILPAFAAQTLEESITSGATLELVVAVGSRDYQMVLVGIPELGVGHIYCSDLTQVRIAERKQEEQRDFLRQITDQLGEGVYALDREGCITFLNQAGATILGWSPEELLGKKIHDLIHYQNPTGELIPSSECPVHKAIQTGEVYRVEEDVFTHRGGMLIPVAFVATPLLREGQVVGSVTVFQDITQRRQVTQEIKQARDLALEAARLKSEFLANMSHEIRTPMNGVIGMTEMLIATKLNKEQKELAQTIRESAHALLTIINDILDFSKIEAGKLDLDAVGFSPLKLVEGVAELLASQAHSKGLDLYSDVAAEVPSLLRGDPGRLRQVLLNLVGNAVKFTKKGEVVIRATLVEKSKAHATVRFAVIDTGIGVLNLDQNRLFQPFLQGDGSSTREYGGTGLGLSIAKRLVDMMGGGIGVESRKKGRGSVFWFTVGFARAPEAEEQAAVMPVSAVGLVGYRALVVDHHSTSQTIITNHLLGWGVRAATVETPAEALAHLRHEAAAGQRFDLALIDFETMLGAGVEHLDSVIDEFVGSGVKLVLISTMSEHKIHGALVANRFSSLLFKPLRRHQLLDCLVEVLLTTETTSAADAEAVAVRGGVAAGEHIWERMVLLVEDNQVNQKVAQLQLNRLGFGVHTVANGREAVDMVRHAEFGLILMDCQMPVMNGFQATMEIRRLEQERGGKHVPIIAMTANAMKGDRERCLDSGMDDYLGKPVQLEEMAAKLRQWFPLAREVVEVMDCAGQAESDPVGGLGEERAVDLPRLSAMFDGDIQTVEEVIGSFLESARELMLALKKGLKQKDHSELVRVAYELQGASANVGAAILADFSRQLEEAGAVRDWGRCRVLLDAMQNQVREIGEAVK